MLRSATRLSLVRALGPRASASARSPLALSPALALVRRHLSTETRTLLESAVKSSPIVLFMKGTPSVPQCGFSRAVAQVLEMHKVPKEKIRSFDVLQDSELRSGIKEFSEWPTVPQLYVNGEFVGGCDIVLGMHQSGELEELLEKHDILPPLEQSETPSAVPSS